MGEECGLIWISWLVWWILSLCEVEGEQREEEEEEGEEEEEKEKEENYDIFPTQTNLIPPTILLLLCSFIPPPHPFPSDGVCSQSSGLFFSKHVTNLSNFIPFYITLWVRKDTCCPESKKKMKNWGGGQGRFSPNAATKSKITKLRRGGRGGNEMENLRQFAIPLSICSVDLSLFPPRSCPSIQPSSLPYSLHPTPSESRRR